MSFTGKKKDHTILRFSIFNALSLWNVAKTISRTHDSRPTILLFIAYAFEIKVILVIWLARIGEISSRIAPFFALSQRGSFTKIKQTIACIKNQWKWRTNLQLSSNLFATRSTKHVYKLKRYASTCGIQTSKLNIHKIARQPYDSIHTSPVFGARLALNIVSTLAYLMTLSQIFDKYMTSSQVCHTSTAMPQYAQL